MVTEVELYAILFAGSVFAFGAGYILGRRSVRLANPLVLPGVRVVEEDVSPARPIPTSVLAMVGPATDGPVEKPTYIGPSIQPVRWWQAWRWHQRGRYRRECREARETFEREFGAPRG